MNIAHPLLSIQQNMDIEKQLSQDEAQALAVLEEIQLRKRFLSATKISNILKNIPLEIMTICFDYIYDSNSEQPYNFQGIKIYIGDSETKLLGNFNNQLTLEFFNFIANMEDSFFNAKDYRFKLDNNDDEIKRFLKKLLANEYELWQNLYFEEIFSEKHSIKKSLKI